MIESKNLGTKLLDIVSPVVCRIVVRLNRFVVSVAMLGESYQACINNTGRLGEFLTLGKE